MVLGKKSTDKMKRVYLRRKRIKDNGQKKLQVSEGEPDPDVFFLGE